MSNLYNAQTFAAGSNKQKKRVCLVVRPGDQFGECTIIKEIGRKKNGGGIYRAECSCGLVITITELFLRRNKSLMCYYCSLREKRRERQAKRAWMFQGLPSPENKKAVHVNRDRD